MAKIDARVLSIGGVVLLLVLFFLVPYILRISAKKMSSSYTPPIYSEIGNNDSQIQTPPPIQNAQPTAPMGGQGVSTSMLPKEIPSQEDFGNFSPEVIMAGQNYLDPRSQIGYPETLGGVLRNANYDVRSEPPNPRVPVSIFNNSTIVPDLMRPQFEIGR